MLKIRKILLLITVIVVAYQFGDKITTVAPSSSTAILILKTAIRNDTIKAVVTLHHWLVNVNSFLSTEYENYQAQHENEF